jgi:hypothetical protein
MELIVNNIKMLFIQHSIGNTEVNRDFNVAYYCDEFDWLQKIQRFFGRSDNGKIFFLNATIFIIF